MSVDRMNPEPMPLDDLTALSEEWRRCRGWLREALEMTKGTHSEYDIIDLLYEGAVQFWPGRNCAALTEILLFPRTRLCNWFLVGGDLEELMEEMAPSVEAWAREQGCMKMMGIGRPGWERKLKDYRKTAVLIEKDLYDG